jgi:hypothetical protein
MSGREWTVKSYESWGGGRGGGIGGGATGHLGFKLDGVQLLLSGDAARACSRWIWDFRFLGH